MVRELLKAAQDVGDMLYMDMRRPSRRLLFAKEAVMEAIGLPQPD
jgi:hypothetical protein